MYTEAATDLKKKIIKQIEVSATIIRYCPSRYNYKFNYNTHFTVVCIAIPTCGVILI